MINNMKKYGKYIGVTACLFFTLASTAGCNNSDDLPAPTVSYGPEIGFADGNVDLSGETPIINISDIKSPIGANIDFLSGVTITNENNFDDLEVWADASTVDIFTPGNYTATYTFNYDGKSVSKDITVTIFETEIEQSASNTIDQQQGSVESSSGNNSQEQNTTGNNNSQKPTGSSSTVTPSSDVTKPSENDTTISGGSSENNNTTKPTNSGSSSQESTSSQKPTGTQEPTATQKPTSSQKPTSTQATSTTRQIVTTSGDKTTKSVNIGNYTIELLSGKTITIRNTTAKYIVSTRTDIKTTTRNGNTYKVSTLIITFNTGYEQILETVEERIK